MSRDVSNPLSCKDCKYLNVLVRRGKKHYYCNLIKRIVDNPVANNNAPNNCMYFGIVLKEWMRMKKK